LTRGYRLKHFGTIIHAMLHKEFGAIVDKVQVRLMTRPEDVAQALPKAGRVYEARDERLRGMTDESR